VRRSCCTPFLFGRVGRHKGAEPVNRCHSRTGRAGLPARPLAPSRTNGIAQNLLRQFVDRGRIGLDFADQVFHANQYW